jgi:UDP-N-acetylglucosamine 2-epimerase (non-hydrolysing)
MTVFGTRPEVIKLAPVVTELARRSTRFRSVVVSSGQHVELLDPFVKLFGLTVDHDLAAMRPGQHLNQLFARVTRTLDPILDAVRPDAVLVQGDTTTAVAAALAAFQRRVPVGHVEAGLRTGDPHSPFPEEMNRRLIARLARWHFAGTRQNVTALRREGVPAAGIFRTGNPVVDALRWLGDRPPQSDRLRDILAATTGLKRITLTAHRRESFGTALERTLRVARHFLDRHPDTALVFPMHPNPVVREKAYSVLGGVERAHLTDPFDYPDFIALLRHSWLIASDSGGVQEEAPSLGVPLLVLRESTERPEAVACGAATLAPTADAFAALLDAAYWSAGGDSAPASDPSGHETEVDDSEAPPIRPAAPVPASARRNPFGDGRAAVRIANVLTRELSGTPARKREAVR